MFDVRGQVFSTPCPESVVVDGTPYFEINDVPPSEIGAMEVYAAATIYPMEYGVGGCGLILIWTKR